MWLINAETLVLEQHAGPDIDAVQAQIGRDLDLEEPPSYAAVGQHRLEAFGVRYAILSHRWQEDEVTMREFHDPVLRESKKGFKKIQRCCQIALNQGIKYVWVDTCCIDKTNLHELSESINSMYVWYQAAIVCFAHFSDTVQSEGLEDSQWFKRGWTLQELIAPRRLMLYDKDWEFMGDRFQLSARLSKISGVDEDLLKGKTPLFSYSVAQRMRWMSERATTRAEDSAYCMLGLFGVNMPLTYGEGGSRAFRRLQEAIIHSTYDHTIFAWQSDDNSLGLLALAPKAFLNKLPVSSRTSAEGYKPYTVANGGISITLQVAPWHIDTYLMLLECAPFGSSESAVGIFLRRLPAGNGMQRWARVSHNGRNMLTGAELRAYTNESSNDRLNFQDRLLIVPQGSLSRADRDFLGISRGFGFKMTERVLGLDRKVDKQTIVKPGPCTRYDAKSSLLYKATGAKSPELFGILDLAPMKYKIKAMKIFLDFDFNPVIFLAESEAIEGKLCSPGRQLLPQEKQERRTFSERDVHDTYGWNVTRTSEDGKQVAMPNTRHMGLWMLRGDRVHGLDVELQSLNNSTPARVRVYLEKAKSANDPVYWVVDLENMPAREGFFTSSKTK